MMAAISSGPRSCTIRRGWDAQRARLTFVAITGILRGAASDQQSHGRAPSWRRSESAARTAPSDPIRIDAARHAEREAAALAFLGLDPDAAAVGLHDLLADRQAEAVAGAVDDVVQPVNTYEPVWDFKLRGKNVFDQAVIETV